MNATQQTSDAPFQGLADKVGLIRDNFKASLRYPAVRSFAEKASMGDDGKPSVQNLFTFLRARLRYIPDPVGVELIKAPWVMVSEIGAQGWSAGDCDDFAALSYSLLRLVGIPAELAVAWYGDNANPTHIFTTIPAQDGGLIPFDLVAPRLGVTKDGISKVATYV